MRSPRPQSPARRNPRVSLARALSKLGHCSRSQGVEVVRSGRVRVNGRVERDPDARVDLDRDRIAVDDAALGVAPPVYLMINKPRGLVTSTSDERGRNTVYACLPPGAELPWVSPVGRLDKASEGLLLFTNDTRWAARVLDPATHLDKTYHVQVDRLVGEDLLRRMEAGVEVADGERLAARGARLLRRGERNSWLEIVLDEGKNRQIRRLLEALDVEVLRLVRVAIGPLRLGELAKGGYRHLSDEEKRALDRAMQHAARRRETGGGGSF